MNDAMKSVILAAGVASRLYPLTLRTPKCLLRVGGVPLLRLALERQARAGITEAVVVVGWLADEIRAAVAGWRLPLPVRFVENRAYDTTNNEYSLHLAAGHVAGRSFLLHDGDIVFDDAVLAAVLGAPTPTALALRSAGPLGDEEMKAACASDGRLLAISKQVATTEAAGEVPGVSRFSAEASARLFACIAARVARGVRNAWYEAALDELIGAGEVLHAVDVGDAYLAEIDTPEDLERVDDEVRGRWPVPAAPAVSFLVCAPRSRARTALLEALLREPGNDFEIVVVDAENEPPSTSAREAREPRDPRLRLATHAAAPARLLRVLGREAAVGRLVLEIDACALPAEEDAMLAGLAALHALVLLRAARSATAAARAPADRGAPGAPRAAPAT